MLLELQEKITYRIREQLIAMIDGADPLYGTTSPADMRASSLHTRLKWSLLNDPTFISEMAKRIGQKMQTVY
jgi:hypothetical protein